MTESTTMSANSIRGQQDSAARSASAAACLGRLYEVSEVKGDNFLVSIIIIVVAIRVS